MRPRFSPSRAFDENRSRFMALAFSSTPRVTTLLAICWGFSAACLFFRALLIQQDLSLALAALVSLVIVWAALERKRWGRQGLLGLGIVTLSLFGPILFLHSGHGPHHAPAFVLLITRHLRTALERYAQSKVNAFASSLLAAITVLWLSRKPVIEEYESKKRGNLASAQRTIALTLVACWAIAVITLPRSFDQKLQEGATLTATRQQFPAQASVNETESLLR